MQEHSIEIEVMPNNKDNTIANLKEQMHYNTIYKSKLNLSNYSKLININVLEQEFLV